MNFSIQKSENSLQKVSSGSNNSNLSEKSNLSNKSKINMNSDQKTLFKLTENSTKLNYNENVHVIDLFEINKQILIEVLFKIPELNSPKKLNFLLFISFDKSHDRGFINDISISPNSINTTNTICDSYKVRYCNATLQIGDFLTDNIKIDSFNENYPYVIFIIFERLISKRLILFKFHQSSLE